MSVGANLAASALANAWIALVQIAFVPVYIRFLGVEAYGLIGVYAFLQISLWILDMGLTPALSRWVARASAGDGGFDEPRRLLRSVEWAFAGLGAMVVVAAAAGAPWLASRWLRIETLAPGAAEASLAFIGALIAVRLFIGAYRGVVSGAQRLVWLSGAGSAFATLRGAGVIGVLWISPAIEAFFAFQLAVTIAEALTMNRKAWRLVPSTRPASFSVDALRAIRRYSGGATLLAVLLLALTQADKLLLSALLPLGAFAHYALASSVAGTISLLTAPASSVAFPRLNELAARGDPRAYAGAFHAFAQVLGVATAPAAIVLALFAPEVLGLWTRDAAVTRAAAPLLAPLALGALLFALTSMPFLLPMVRGTPGVLARAYAVLVVAYVPALWLTVPAHGAMAAAWAWVALNACGIAVAVAFVAGDMARVEAWRWLLRDALLPTVAALAGAGAARWVFPGNDLEEPGIAAASLTIAYALSLAASAACAPVVRARLASPRHLLESVTTFRSWRQ